MSKMHVKLEIQSGRVKSLCFHDSRPWLLASFHTGEIIIYDYEVGVEIQRYNEFTVPVRTACFHPSLPLFAAGADDTCIKIFNYDEQRCIATFTEHLDYIRTVQFHPTKPFLVSASDDQTIRIWNYETNLCLTSISGHNHYVMSAFFHPTLPLVLSASLDDSVRVWDISSLFNDGQSSGGIFSITDAVMKFTQEEHTAGVNWAAWHPNKPMAVSCSDDESVKIWRIVETEMSLVATLRGHTGNISCACFMPNMDLVLSCSEDQTVRVWDSKRFVHLSKYKSEGNRFWCVAAHPVKPIFAAGHDNGLVIYSVTKNAPAYDTVDGNIYYYKENAIRAYNIKDESGGVTGYIKQRSSTSRQSPIDPKPTTVSYNPTHKVFLVGYPDRIEIVPANGKPGDDNQVIQGFNPVWIGRNQFVFQTDSQTQNISLREIGGSSTSTLTLKCRKIFPGPPGTIFGTDGETLFRYDIMRRSQISQTHLSNIKKVIMSPDRKHIGMLTSTDVIISDIDFNNITKVTEVVKTKSGVWFDSNVFVYSTRTHVKYLLINGEGGTLKSTPQTLYVAAISDKLYGLNIQDTVRKFPIDTLEIKFRLAIMENRIDAVVATLRSAKVCSTSIIDYLHKHGHPEIAVQFVHQPRAKFDLAMESGNLELGVDAATELADPVIWDRIADEAMAQGRFTVAEQAFKKSGNMERLAFLYLISGQTQKLNSLKVDDSLSLQRAIWSNDFKTEAILLHDVAPSIAYIAADGDDSLQSSIQVPDEIKDELKKFAKHEITSSPLKTVEKLEDWPTLYINRPKYVVTPGSQHDDDDDVENDDEENGWNFNEEAAEAKEENGEEDDDEENGWDMDDIQFDVTASPGQGAAAGFIVPSPGQSVSSQWMEGVEIAGQYAAAGEFGLALQVLSEQIALINAEPLKEHFVASYIASHVSIPALACAPPIISPLTAKFLKRKAPSPYFSIERMEKMIEEGSKLMTKGKFNAAKLIFLSLLQSIPIASVSTVEEQRKVIDAVEICRKYVIAAMLGIAQNSIKKPDKRKLEYLLYIYALKLDEKMQNIALNLAVNIATTLGCFKTALMFATDERTRKVIESKSQGNKTDAVKVDFTPVGNFEVCCNELVQIPIGEQKVSCPFCGATYKASHANELCSVCQLSKVGGIGTGLKINN